MGVWVCRCSLWQCGNKIKYLSGTLFSPQWSMIALCFWTSSCFCHKRWRCWRCWRWWWWLEVNADTDTSSTLQHTSCMLSVLWNSHSLTLSGTVLSRYKQLQSSSSSSHSTWWFSTFNRMAVFYRQQSRISPSRLTWLLVTKPTMRPEPDRIEQDRRAIFLTVRQRLTFFYGTFYRDQARSC